MVCNVFELLCANDPCYVDCGCLADHDKIKSESSSKELSNTSASSDLPKLEGGRPQKGGVSFQRVTYGGINGAYYTASTTQRTGKDGVSCYSS